MGTKVSNVNNVNRNFIEAATKTLKKEIKSAVVERLEALEKRCVSRKLNFVETAKHKLNDIIASEQTVYAVKTLRMQEIKEIRKKGGNAYAAYSINTKEAKGIKSASIGKYAGFAICTNEVELRGLILNEARKRNKIDECKVYAIVKNKADLPYTIWVCKYDKRVGDFSLEKVNMIIGKMTDVVIGTKQAFESAAMLTIKERINKEIEIKA